MKTNQRGWTPIEDAPQWEDEDYYDKVKAECDGLAKWWSELHHEEEQEDFRSMTDDAMHLRDDYDPPRRSWYPKGEAGDAEYEEDCAAEAAQFQKWEDERKAKESMRRSQAEFCEEKLYKLGARMMRPYKHWNEDEAYMEYAERDRD